MEGMKESVKKFLSDGSGSGYGSGYGSGSGSYIASVNHHVAALVDGVLTVFRSIHKNIARGWVLKSDMVLVPCFVVKSGALFAHGETLRDAMSAMRDKLFEDMPEEDRIKAFAEEYKPGIAVSNHDLFDWHHRLTGSCLMGRNEFVERHGIDLNASTTPEAFIRLTEHAYGGDVIRKLRSFYDMD